MDSILHLSSIAGSSTVPVYRLQTGEGVLFVSTPMRSRMLRFLRFRDIIPPGALNYEASTWQRVVVYQRVPRAADLVAALSLIDCQTRGLFLCSILGGYAPRARAARQRIMRYLIGRDCPLIDCDEIVLEAELLRLAGVACIGARDKDDRQAKLRAWCKLVLRGGPVPV